MTKYSVLYPSGESDGYGIKIVTERNIYDISVMLEPVQRLCDACNRAGLSPEHFDDVLENYLADRETF